MPNIIPHLWFDTQAVEAANWYVSLFAHSQIAQVSQLHDTPSGDVDTVEFTLDGVDFSAISAGPYFTLNDSISLMVTCRSADEVDALYAHLGRDATILMPLDAYPFSKRYVWYRIASGSVGSFAILKPTKSRKRSAPFFSFRRMFAGAQRKRSRFTPPFSLERVRVM